MAPSASLAPAPAALMRQSNAAGAAPFAQDEQRYGQEHRGPGEDFEEQRVVRTIGAAGGVINGTEELHALPQAVEPAAAHRFASQQLLERTDQQRQLEALAVDLPIDGPLGIDHGQLRD